MRPMLNEFRLISRVYIGKREIHMTEKVAKATKRRALYFSILGGMILCFALIYLLIGLQYKNRFFPNVMINEIDVSGMTAEQVQEDLNHLSKDYALYIQTRDDKEEILYGKDFGLTFQFEDADMIAQLIANQKFWKWGINLFPHTRYEISVMADYDKKKLESLIKGLSCMDSKKMVQPEDAYLTYDTDNGIHIVPEIKGSLIKVKAFREQVVEAVENVVSHISLEDLELYEEPKIYQDNQSLNERYNLWKQHLDTQIVYHFDENTEILDATIFYEWMSEDEKGGIVFDKERIQEFVKGLAKKYNTGYSSKEFETSYGETVTIKGGPYGWLINQPEEVDALEAALLACESQDREPVYFQTAASHSKPDYGDTYVEINLSAQHLFLYKDGELIVESDFVSGNESRGWATPAGAFPLTYKERNTTLKGANYATPVSYWMPFNGNIGMHDSSWRKSYGKNIYKKNGSHGCINLPPDVAQIIYENIEKGMPVLCYQLGGTEWVSSEPETEDTQIPEEAEPAIDMEQPGIGVEQPGMDIQAPGIGVEQPGMDIQAPGIGVEQPGMDILPPAVGIDPPVVVDPAAEGQPPIQDASVIPIE